MIVRYGKRKFKKKRKQIPSHFATQKKAGGNPFTSYTPYKKKGGSSKLSMIKMRTYGKKGGSGSTTGFMRRIKPYTKIKRKKKKNPGKRPKRVNIYTRGGEMFNVWHAQARARERRDNRLKEKAGGSISGCRMSSGGQVTGCHFNV